MPPWHPPLGPGGCLTWTGNRTGPSTPVPCAALPWTASHCPTGYTALALLAPWAWQQVFNLLYICTYELLVHNLFASAVPDFVCAWSGVKGCSRICCRSIWFTGSYRTDVCFSHGAFACTFVDLHGEEMKQSVLSVPANGWLDCTLLFAL